MQVGPSGAGSRFASGSLPCESFWMRIVGGPS